MTLTGDTTVCDTLEFIKLDTKTIDTADGQREYWFAVIGDPCDGRASCCNHLWRLQFQKLLPHLLISVVYVVHQLPAPGC